MIAPWTRWRLRPHLQPRDADEKWLAVARELTGGWWLVTATSVVVVPAGQTSTSVPHAGIRHVDISIDRGSLTLRMTTERGIFIGTFSHANAVTRWLDQQSPQPGAVAP